MKLFEYTKYFFDVFSGEEDYRVLFISILRTGKIDNTYIQIHFSGNDYSGKHTAGYSLRAKLKLIDSQLNKITFKEGEIDLGTESVKINLAASDFAIDLEYSNAHGVTHHVNPFFIRTSGTSFLSWTPVQLKGRVNGKISAGGNQINYYNAKGYIDEVKTSVLPVRLQIRKLFWGRLHHQEIDLTYSIVTDKKHKSESMLFLYFKSVYDEFKNVKYETFNEKFIPDLNITRPDKVILMAKNERYSITIGISYNKELILNDFMDPGDQYNKVFFRILRRISENPKGVKFLAIADILIDDGFKKSEFQDLPMISEFVVFS